MDIDSEGKRLTELYSSMTDEELEELAGDQTSLTAEARQALNGEISHRGLSFIPRESPPPTEDPEPSELVTIRKFRDLMDADLAKGLLESVGIESFLIDENMVRMDWLISTGIGGIKLQVKREDAEAAMTVLDQPIPGGPEVEG
ncbi:MAG: DUF2007 domain-containing protein [Acidobacteriia bacterium]|nr:DUF2007 domain-containing protein [Terriglobia bacterium]